MGLQASPSALGPGAAPAIRQPGLQSSILTFGLSYAVRDRASVTPGTRSNQNVECAVPATPSTLMLPSLPTRLTARSPQGKARPLAAMRRGFKGDSCLASCEFSRSWNLAPFLLESRLGRLLPVAFRCHRSCVGRHALWGGGAVPMSLARYHLYRRAVFLPL